MSKDGDDGVLGFNCNTLSLNNTVRGIKISVGVEKMGVGAIELSVRTDALWTRWMVSVQNSK